ncbi:uncharacterized protein YdcH (DUF465 family) [Paraburkholderia sp. WC7.3g]|uniref:hypothetical protein n=1 Tax=Paraburkholderia sp. WC7.3g TaxID=2991070 RepID=UPI003D1E66B2
MLEHHREFLPDTLQLLRVRDVEIAELADETDKLAKQISTKAKVVRGVIAGDA